MLVLTRVAMSHFAERRAELTPFLHAPLPLNSVVWGPLGTETGLLLMYT